MNEIIKISIVIFLLHPFLLMAGQKRRTPPIALRECPRNEFQILFRDTAGPMIQQYILDLYLSEYKEEVMTRLADTFRSEFEGNEKGRIRRIIEQGDKEFIRIAIQDWVTMYEESNHFSFLQLLRFDYEQRERAYLKEAFAKHFGLIKERGPLADLTRPVENSVGNHSTTLSPAPAHILASSGMLVRSGYLRESNDTEEKDRTSQFDMD